MAKYEELCTQILEQVGGKENVTSAVHCMTRLRINYKDQSKINVDAVKGIKGVLGAQFSGGQFQVIIGQHVSEVYPEFCAMAGVGTAAAIDENLDGPKEPFSIKAVPGKVLDYISGSIAPILPIMMAAGFFKLFYALFGPSLLNICDESSDLMQMLYWVGDAGFYFMPVFVAYGAAKKMNTSIPLALLLTSLLVYPDIVALPSTVESFKMYGFIPMALNSYTSSLLPTLFTVWVLKYVYAFFDKHMIKSIKVIGTPFVTVAIVLPLMFCLLAPIGSWISTGIAALVTALYNFAGPVCIALIGAIWMYCVATGMHIAVIQIAIINITTLGYDPVVLAGSNIANYALMGMVVAYFLRTKGDEKEMAGANCITLLVGGISEPTLFGILLRNKRAMLSYSFGGAIGGLIGGILGAKVYVLATSNFLTILAYAGPGNNMLYAGFACAAAFLGALIVGLMFGFGTPGEGEGLKGYKPKPKKAK